MSKIRMLRPLHNNIVIRPDPVENVTSAGVIIPDGSTKASEYGTVLAVGPGKDDGNGALCQMPDLLPGDQVLFAKYGGVQIRFNDETLYVLKPDDLHAQRVD